jgi:hypothetical protein
MKTILAIAAVIAIYSCAPPRELEAEMVNAELIRIDTVFRNQDPQQILTWRDDYNIHYVTYATMNRNYSVGNRMLVLVKR